MAQLPMGHASTSQLVACLTGGAPVGRLPRYFAMDTRCTGNFSHRVLVTAVALLSLGTRRAHAFGSSADDARTALPGAPPIGAYSSTRRAIAAKARRPSSPLGPGPWCVCKTVCSGKLLGSDQRGGGILPQNTKIQYAQIELQLTCMPDESHPQGGIPHNQGPWI